MRPTYNYDFRALKVALIADELTTASLAGECRLCHVTPWNYLAVFKLWKPDIFFVESSWKGYRERWKYKMASYPDRPERTNAALARVVKAARNAAIPTIFWNREDGAHFDRFIHSAKLFEHVLTVDENMLPHYRQALGSDAKVDVMMFAAQPAIHHPSNVVPINRASFVGSYGTHVHPARRVWQDMVFDAASEIGITVHDRNSGRKPTHYRYPVHPWIELRNAIPYSVTADVYRRHAVNINVNTVMDSPTAFSRRLVEIIACSALAATNRTPAVERYFKDYCRVIDNGEDAREVFNRIARDGLSAEDKDRASAGAAYVLENHSWRHRLAQILDIAA